MTNNIREKLVELICKVQDYGEKVKSLNGSYSFVERNDNRTIADHLIANGVTVQEVAYWKDVMDCGVGNCFGICSNCLTQQKAASYASLMTEYRHCRWCGARMVYQPPKGE